MPEKEEIKNKTVIIVATGQSMSPQLAEKLKGYDVIAVNNAYQICPWAKFLVFQDRAWWKYHGKDVREKFKGLKYSTHNITGVNVIRKVPGMESTSNSSAVLATYLAHQLGYKKVILLGVDCWGTHYFGPHPSPLKNTKPHRFQVFQKQFATAKEKLSDMEIVNCSEGTALTTIPVSTLQKEGILE